MSKGPNEINSTEEHYLFVIRTLEPAAYGANIRRAFEAAGKNISIGALYVTLERLEKRGFIKSSEKEEVIDGIDRRRAYYRITGLGETALNEAHAFRARLQVRLA